MVFLISDVFSLSKIRQLFIKKGAANGTKILVSCNANSAKGGTILKLNHVYENISKDNKGTKSDRRHVVFRGYL